MKKKYLFLFIILIFFVNCIPAKKLRIKANDYDGYEYTIIKENIHFKICGSLLASNHYNIMIIIRNKSNYSLNINTELLSLKSQNLKFETLKNDRTIMLSIGKDLKYQVKPKEDCNLEMVAMLQHDSNFNKKLVTDVVSLELNGFSINDKVIEFDPITMTLSK